MELILIGVDPTSSSHAAVEWVAQVAPALGARALVVHVVPSTLEWELAAIQVNATPHLRQRRRDLAGRWTEPLRGANVPYTIEFVKGDPGKELLRLADRRGADLIAIGAAHHGRVHDIIFGATTRRLVNQIRHPVVMVPSSSTTTLGPVWDVEPATVP